MMSRQTVYYVGTEEEVAHHARPIAERFDVQFVEPTAVVQCARPGDLAIFFSEHFQRFREAIPLLRRRQCATLYAIDGILEWRNAWENRPLEPASPFTMRPVLSDKVACIGRSQARLLEAWGNADRIEIVGLPRLDGLSARARRNDAEDFRLLIMSAKWPGFTEDQVRNAELAFADLRDWLADHPVIDGRKIVPHWRLTGGLDETLGVENRLRDLSGGDLATALQDSDAVITMPSTVMLEGMKAGLPVALIEYNPCPRLVPAAWEINSAVHLDAVVRQLARPPEEKLHFQSHLLADALECATPATPRLTQLVEQMLAHAAACVERDEPVRFPGSLLPYRGEGFGTGTTAFDHRQIYVDHAAFAESDLAQLQIQLADARRELDQRDQRIAQLQSELGQAHEIFEQIHRHPIAGPVVRIRRRIREWLAGLKRRRGRRKLDASGSGQ